MNNNKIGKFIARKRKEANLTQMELANKLYVTDKAVSKWERGLSLPDVTLLKKLASELNVTVADILDGNENNSKRKIDEEEVNEIIDKINKANKKKRNKILFIVAILLLVIVYILFRNMYLGYNEKKVYYRSSNKTLHIGVPKTSFMMKKNDRSYSFKNLRNPNIVENEIKKYLKTLKYSSCNNTIYYYNKKDNYSIINYSVKNHVLYNTISYEVVNYDYCNVKKIDEYTKKLGRAKAFHTMNSKISFYDSWDNKLQVLFQDLGIDDNKGNFKCNFIVRYYKRKDDKNAYIYTIEKSSGTFEIKNNKLYYYRDIIEEKDDNINIPNVSSFKIDDKKLILEDNYLSNYEQNIVLE